MKKIYYKHKTPLGNVRLFRWTMRLRPSKHQICLYHIGHSDGHYYLELTLDGKLYGKFYRCWKTK